MVGSPFYAGKLAWFERLLRWLAESASPDDASSSAATSTSPRRTPTCGTPRPATAARTSPAGAAAFRLLDWGLVDAYRQHHSEPGRYTWWDYRAGNFHKNFGMRIDHLLVTPRVAADRRPRSTARRARASRLPSDHAPLVIDLDEPGVPFDAGWEAAGERIAARGGIKPKRQRAMSPQPPASDWIVPPAPFSGRINLVDYDPEMAGPVEAVAPGSAQPSATRRSSWSMPAPRPSRPGRKDQIDVVLGVPDSTDEAAYVAALEAAGFEFAVREPEWFEHRLFRGRDRR